METAQTDRRTDRGGELDRLIDGETGGEERKKRGFLCAPGRFFLHSGINPVKQAQSHDRRSSFASSSELQLTSVPPKRSSGKITSSLRVSRRVCVSVSVCVCVSVGESRRAERCSRAGWQCPPLGFGCWRSPGAQDGAHVRLALPQLGAINACVRPPSSQLLRLQERAETLRAQLMHGRRENRFVAVIDWLFDAAIGCFH
ncbi:hypothetical protein CRENBAI_024059 [Crenichthys baileyi]|uniref:Uncharacterized protein n=1 Tax=Crenichthys baileyi TaxID=28760 RepID=A0AAV9SCS7_9TELE